MYKIFSLKKDKRKTLDSDTIFEHLEDVATGTVVLYDTNDEKAELAQGFQSHSNIFLRSEI